MNDMATYMRQAVGPHMLTGLRDLIARVPADLRMAEIGCYAGESTRVWVDSGQVRLLLAVDPWRGDYAQDDGVWHSPHDWERVYQTFAAWAVTQPAVTTLRLPSLAAAELVAPGCLDLVYIDGNHAYAAVYADITAWRPKLKPGGWLAGHDWSTAYPGVARAVYDHGLTERGVALFADTSWLVQV